MKTLIPLAPALLSKTRILRVVFPAWSLLAICLMTLCGSSPAQQYDTERQVRVDKEERALTDQVTLAPEQIETVLRSQPMMMLEVKRALVRKAYEQGRLLDPADLTDAVVLQLVKEDRNVQIVATHEIERQLAARSSYAGQRPASEEAPNAGEEPSPGNRRSSMPRGLDQDIYVDNPLSHPGQVESPQRPKQPGINPAGPPAAPSPQLQVQRAAATSPDRDIPDVLDPSSQLSHISPTDLPAVLGQGGGTSLASLKESNGAGAMGSGLPSIPAPVDVSPAGDSLNVPSSARTSARPNTGAGTNYVETTAIRRRPNPYADVPSLYDIYSQVSKQQPTVDRFAISVFRNGTGNLEELPMDLPVGPEYVIGPGDGLNIQLWGGVSQRLTRTVDREGRIALPEVGSMMVAGKSMGQLQHDVQALLRTQFKDIQADVSLARLRNVRIYVVGDVQRPGPYDISALSTPLNAVYAAGGPTQNGSLRVVQHLRGKELVQKVDLYDLLLNGIRDDIKPLQPGDTILVPPIGPQVKVEGMVRRPAIYELNGEQNLAEVLQLSGGVLPTGTLRHIDVERVVAHSSRSMLSLDIPETNDQQQVAKALEDFKIQDGDAVRISPILPYSDKTVYLEGHVFRPGKYTYQPGMKVADLIKSYAELLPEPYTKHAEIIRLSKPDFRPVVIPFNLAEALSSQTAQDFKLEPFDTVRVFGRFDFEDSPTITVNGEVREPGVHRTNGATRLSDAVYLAGGVTPDAMLGDTQIIRSTEDGKLKVMSANLGLALKGDTSADIMLMPKDRVIVHRSMARIDPPAVTVEGEVAHPGKYPLGSDLTAAGLVRMAGGFKRSAYKDSADLSRYVIENGKKIVGEHIEVAISKAMSGEEDTDYRLRDGDVLTIRMIGGWKDVGGTINVKGEVVHPGVYGIEEGERLSSVLKRAGGFRPDAYAYGAVFERVQVREVAEKNRQELIQRIEGGGNIRVASDAAAEGAGIVQAAMMQQQQVLGALKSQQASGRMVIHISPDISKWEGTVEDVVVRPGDSIVVPKRPYFIMVLGQVYNSNAVTYVPGKEADYYLKQAGGPTGLANTKELYVVRADGSLVGKDSFGGWWGGSVKSLKLRPGDSIIVPEKFVTGSSSLRTFLQAAQILSQIAFTAAVATR
ncbi:MAG TPA: SLBB domain-containing protein [Terriglobales bacterium]|nr:SLBB domain-containing protein [Terriglobales bacterium]